MMHQEKENPPPPNPLFFSRPNYDSYYNVSPPSPFLLSFPPGEITKKKKEDEEDATSSFRSFLLLPFSCGRCHHLLLPHKH